MPSPKLSQLNKHEKPREKMVTLGAENLTDEELVAILLRSGSRQSSAIDLARALLKKLGGIKGLLTANINTLCSVQGIGLAKATTIKACLELSLRSNENKDSKINISAPKEVYNHMKGILFGKKREHLYLLSLDTKNRLLGKDLIAIGTLNETYVHIKEIFRTALQRGAVSILLVHNHPSGDTQPSDLDVKVTNRICKMGKFLDVELLDHIIIGDLDYTSLKSLGLLSEFKLDKRGGERIAKKH